MCARICSTSFSAIWEISALSLCSLGLASQLYTCSEKSRVTRKGEGGVLPPEDLGRVGASPRDALCLQRRHAEGQPGARAGEEALALRDGACVLGPGTARCSPRGARREAKENTASVQGRPCAGFEGINSRNKDLSDTQADPLKPAPQGP